MTNITIDHIAFSVFFVCIITYAFITVYGFRHPSKSKRGSLNIVYQKWVDERIEDSSLVAIQAMRNLIMANSVFISALLVLLGLLLGFYSVIFSDQVFFLPTIPIGLVQVTLLTLVIIFCIFNFVLSIRMLVRFTLLIGVKPNKINICGHDGLDFTKNTLLSGQTHWTIGLRGLFYLIIILAWLIHPLLFSIGSIGVTSYLIFFEDQFNVLD
ncbi:MAG: DUF599 family protein [Candidatus Hodarchaeota archaeon]